MIIILWFGDKLVKVIEPNLPKEKLFSRSKLHFATCSLLNVCCDCQPLHPSIQYFWQFATIDLYI